MFIREDTATKGPVTPTCRTRFLAAVMHYAAPARSADDGANPQRTTRNRCRRLPGATSASPSHWLIVVWYRRRQSDTAADWCGVVKKSTLCFFSTARPRAQDFSGFRTWKAVFSKSTKMVLVDFLFWQSYWGFRKTGTRGCQDLVRRMQPAHRIEANGTESSKGEQIKPESALMQRNRPLACLTVFVQNMKRNIKLYTYCNNNHCNQNIKITYKKDLDHWKVSAEMLWR